MHIEFWIASHLSTSLRVDYLKYALTSINEQTRLPDSVRISLSSAQDIYCPTDYEINSLLYNISHVCIYRHNDRMMQFEHLHHIWEDAKLPEDSWVAFCDDDDLNAPTRLENFIAGMRTNNENPILMYGSGTFAFNEECSRFGNIKYRYDAMRDFGSLICNSRLLDKYFTTDHADILAKHKGLADVYFRIIYGRNTYADSPGEGYAYRIHKHSQDYNKK